MNFNINSGEIPLPSTYLNQARDALQSRDNIIQQLICHVHILIFIYLLI